MITLLLFSAVCSRAQITGIADSIARRNANSTSNEIDETDEEIIERYERQTDAGYDFSDYLNFTFSGSAVNINNATESELRRLHLNDQQIHNINQYIEKYGELTSIYELNLVEGFDSVLIKQLEPKLVFKLDRELHKITFRNLTQRGKHTLLSRYQKVLEQQKGYSYGTTRDSVLQSDNQFKGYAGSPDKLLFKYNYNFYNRLRFGLTMEKDPGEPMAGGFDFYSFHFYTQSRKFVKRLALGDYYLLFGQGLTMQNGFGFSGNHSTGMIFRKTNAVKPATGANETGPFRGGAVTLSPDHGIELTLFYSKRSLDANILNTDTLESSISYFSTTMETGLHRTFSEISKKNAIEQQVYGSNLQTRLGIVKLGATVLNTSTDAIKSPDKLPYKMFRFNGNNLTNFGTDFSIHHKTVIAYGEVSGSSNGAKAYLAGINFQRSSEFGITVLYRNYARDYHNYFSNAYSFGTECSNESGIYAGFFTQLNKFLQLSAFADHFRFPWLRYRVDAPSYGKEYMVQLLYRLSKENLVTFRYSYNNKPQNDAFIFSHSGEDRLGLNYPQSYESNPPSTGYTNYPVSVYKHQYRINLLYKPSRNLTMKTRAEFVSTDIKSIKGTGFLLYTDIIYSPLSIPVSFNMRYALFETASYNERIYAYESDIPGSYSVPAYSDKGSRFYGMVKYEVSRALILWVRYAQSYYPDKLTVGTGLEENVGNTRSDVRVQMVIKL